MAFGEMNRVEKRLIKFAWLFVKSAGVWKQKIAADEQLFSNTNKDFTRLLHPTLIVKAVLSHLESTDRSRFRGSSTFWLIKSH
jgi:hypothetical protein